MRPYNVSEAKRECPEHGDISSIARNAKFCPECGVEHDRRMREFSKLFSYGTVGRSIATDIILNAELRNLPEKII